MNEDTNPAASDDPADDEVGVAQDGRRDAGVNKNGTHARAAINPRPAPAVNTSGTPTRTHAPPRLDGPQDMKVHNREVAKLPTADGDPTPKRWSALQLAKSLRRRLMRRELGERADGSVRARAFSVTLTTRSGSEAEIRARLPLLLRDVAHRTRRAGMLLAFDVAATGRWHAHVLVLLEPHVDANKLVRWWTRLDNVKAKRPARAAQCVRRLNDGRLADELERVLVHNLARTRAGKPVPAAVPALEQRVQAWGTLTRPWAAVCARHGLVVTVARAAPPRAASRASKASTP
ncbi:MAG: hypothetical protein KIT84_11030 [Labilithrix sp.]|nr:hypothetical protein [Labilithrix sp.]MCW5811541.1 hypothetical protein [Labilithrix sp.]